MSMWRSERGPPCTARAPPVALLALAHAAGALPVHLGASLPPALLLPAALLLPSPLWRCHALAAGLLAAALAGTLGARADCQADLHDCRRAFADGASLRVLGRMAAPPMDGRGALVLESVADSAGPPDPECRGEIPLAFARADSAPPAGRALELSGRWRASPGARSAAWAGTLRVEGWRRVAEPQDADWAAARAALTARGTERLHRSLGARGPLASALVLARREGIERPVRDAFARSGTAHLLSISGFHVAVVGGFLFALLSLVLRRVRGSARAA